MKRYLSILLCVLLMSSLLACAGQPGSESSSTPSAESSVPGSSDQESAGTADPGSQSEESSKDPGPAPTSEGEPSSESSEPSEDPAPSDDLSHSEQTVDDPSQGEPSQDEPSADEPSDDVPSGDTDSTEPDDSSDTVSDDPSQDSSDSSDTSKDDTPGIQFPTRTNVLLGRSYTVNTVGYRTDAFGDFNDPSGTTCRHRLTNGQFSPDGGSDAICGYNDSRVSFHFDLGEDMELLDWTTDLWGGMWGIAEPQEYTVSIYWSLDGVAYHLADSVKPAKSSVTTVGEFKKAVIVSEFEEPICARYVKAVYESPAFIWTSELRVFAQEIPEGKAIPRVNITTLNGDRVHKSDYHQCTLEVIDPSGTYKRILDTNGLIKVRGNSTSSGAKQPFNIKFDAKQNVLGMGACKKWYLLANMYDKTQMRNMLAYDFADDIGMAYVQQSTFVRVYLNGEYRGIYQLCESIGTGSSRVDINPNKNEFLLEYEPWENYANDNWIRTTKFNILLGFNEPDVPTDAQRAWLRDFFRKAETAIASHNITEIEKYLDVDSFIDAFLVEEYFKEVDYQTSSTRFYIKDGKWYAGPVWDFDLSAGNCSSSYYTGYNNVGGSGNSWEGFYCMGLWNSRLFETPEIRERTVRRYKEIQPYIVNLYQDNALGKCRIDAILERFRDEIDLNYTLWSTKEIYSDLERRPTDGTYDSEITYLKKWLKNRNEWLLTAFETF